jgi:hypothetical protein
MYDARLCRGGWLLLAAMLWGCGSQKSAPSAVSPPAKTSRVAEPAKTSTVAVAPPAIPSAKTEPVSPPTKTPPQPQPAEEKRPARRFPAGSSGGTFAEEMQAIEAEEQDLRKRRLQLARPRLLDDDRLKAGGLRKLTGKHVTLYTDLPSKPAIDELPEVFDQAYPQWCEFFRVDPKEQAAWHMRGFLMGEKSRRKFEDLDVIPPQVPDFRAGYMLNYEFFMYEQQSDYYRRHLMLHEGTHGFMWTLMGACTSPWYAEGTAELLGSHLWEKGKLMLRQFPRSREETAYHGRIKLVKACFAEQRAAALNDIVAAAFDLHAGPATDKERQEGYAWCWASSAFLDGHRRYRERFNLLCSSMRTPGAIPGTFRTWYEPDWDDLMEEWQVFVSGLEYGYDMERNAIAFERGAPLPAVGANVAVQADRGWQSAKLTLEAGKTYELTATGRVMLGEVVPADRPQAIESEPDGITIRYHHGLPLGALLAAVRLEKEERDRLTPRTHEEQAKLSQEDAAALRISALLRPIVIGRAARITPKFSGTLYLKINDSAAELADNKGALQVRVTAAAAKK